MDPTLGGVSQALRTIASSVSALGTTNHIVCLDAPDAGFLKTEHLTIFPLGPAKGPWVYSKQLASWLRENLSNYDVVVIHGLWQYQSFATAKAVRAMRHLRTAPKLFIMPHGMLDPYFQRASGRKLKAIRNYVYWKLIESKVVHSASGLLFTCEEEKLLARTSFQPYVPNSELVTGLGVDEPPPFDEALHSARSLGKANDSYLVFLSRLHEKKGVDLLIKAFSRLKKKGPAKHSLIIAGPGLETSYGSELRKLAVEDSTLKEFVTFTGMVTGDLKWATLYNSEAFVLPSHQENFGIAVVEALACGKPVLISDKVNIWREIEGAGCGFIGDDTLDGTADILQKWMLLPDSEKKAMGARARSLYETTFSVQQAASRMLNAISGRK
jgi:glycosyltransferase involved in cell wall biosynthesis